MRNPFYISIQKTGESETIEKLRTNLWDEENRLRAVDITPDAEGVRPIAIYTYDAGGERILKHSNTSVSIYLNGKKVADTIQVDATIYPSGMLVARLGNNGSEEEQTLAYTKHYYAGTQRVSSKIGTTENVGDYLYDWFTQGTGGPVDVVGSSFGVLENAENGVVQAYDELGIEPPTYESTPVFIPVPSFVHGGNEVEQYFFHPDHLGSTSYITNLLGEVSQHMEYFAFGETFVEEHRSSNNSPYKFNGKELDEETGWYYYGARYYDPRISVWLSVDPLAEQTMTPYQYTYQNPINLTDPTGMAPDTWILNSKTGDVTYVDDDSDDIVIVNEQNYNLLQSFAYNYNNNKEAVENNSGYQEVYQYILNKGDRYSPNEYGMVELPHDTNTQNGQYTFEGNALYKFHNRNDERPYGKVEQDQWGTPENIVKFIQLAIGYKNEFNGELISFGDMSTETGGSPLYKNRFGNYVPHKSHFQGSQADIRYPTIGGQTNNISNADITRTQWILNKAADLGMSRRIIGTKAPKSINNFTRKLGDHNDHIHIGSK